MCEPQEILSLVIDKDRLFKIRLCKELIRCGYPRLFCADSFEDGLISLQNNYVDLLLINNNILQSGKYLKEIATGLNKNIIPLIYHTESHCTKNMLSNLITSGFDLGDNICSKIPAAFPKYARIACLNHLLKN